MKSIILKNPILINGIDVKELTYDANEITALLFTEAEARRKSSKNSQNINLTLAAEFDFGLHLYLGMAAIIAVNPSYDFSDLERARGYDTVAIMHIGRNFIFKREGGLQEDGSGGQSGTLPESTTPALTDSNENV